MKNNKKFFILALNILIFFHANRTSDEGIVYWVCWSGTLFTAIFALSFPLDYAINKHYTDKYNKLSLIEKLKYWQSAQLETKTENSAKQLRFRKKIWEILNSMDKETKLDYLKKIKYNGYHQDESDKIDKEIMKIENSENSEIVMEENSLKKLIEEKDKETEKKQDTKKPENFFFLIKNQETINEKNFRPLNQVYPQISFSYLRTFPFLISLKYKNKIIEQDIFKNFMKHLSSQESEFQS